MTTPTAGATLDGSFPTQARRVSSFAAFFKSYMSVWALLVAALPIPIGTFKFIPTFELQRSYLSVYTSLFCFLSLGFVFFWRHRLGYFMFHEKQWSLRFPKIMFHIARGVINWLPLACILVSVFAVFGYHQLLEDALTIAQAQAVAEEDNGTLSKAFLFEMSEWNSWIERAWFAQHYLLENQMTTVALKGKTDPALARATIAEAKAKAERYKSSAGRNEWGKVGELADSYQAHVASMSDVGLGPPPDLLFEAQNFIGMGAKMPTLEEALKSKNVPFSEALMAWYLTIFVAAETAFILMALKEYLQDLAHISDLALMGMESSGAVLERERPALTKLDVDAQLLTRPKRTDT